MFKTRGKLEYKSIIKEVPYEGGNVFKVVQFSISKTKKIFNKKENRFKSTKISWYFEASGKLADKVYNIPKGEKIVIEFYPHCNNVNGKVYTHLRAEDVYKYIPPSESKDVIYNNNTLYSPEVEIKKDNTMF